MTNVVFCVVLSVLSVSFSHRRRRLVPVLIRHFAAVFLPGRLRCRRVTYNGRYLDEIILVQQSVVRWRPADSGQLSQRARCGVLHESSRIEGLSVTYWMMNFRRFRSWKRNK